MKQVYAAVWGVLAAALSVLAVACGGDPGPPTPQQGTESDGFTSYSAEGFSVSVPSEWKVLSGDELASLDTEEFEKENPSLGDINPDDYALLAVDPAPAGDFATSLNVVVGNAPTGRSVEDDEDEAVAQLQSLPIDRASLQHEVIELPAGPALHLEYTLNVTLQGTTESIAARQYGLYGNGNSYILTFETALGDVESHEAQFERAARSFAVG